MRFYLMAVICNNLNDYHNFTRWMPDQNDRYKFKMIQRAEQARGLHFHTYIEIGAPDDSNRRKEIKALVSERVIAYHAWIDSRTKQLNQANSDAVLLANQLQMQVEDLQRDVWELEAHQKHLFEFHHCNCKNIGA